MRAAAAALVTMAFVLVACEREARDFRAAPGTTPKVEEIRMSELKAGPASASAPARGPYDENAYAISQGKRLYTWYNCSGCHAHGGGGIGPALMDDTWIYGHEPANIFATIVEGRPNGMPSFRGRIPDDQVWQLVAYVRSMSGLVRSDAAPGRNDDMQTGPPESRAEKAQPKTVGSPK
jgi:cytochrome c oxidase cbb3-type subunit 3